MMVLGRSKLLIQIQIQIQIYSNLRLYGGCDRPLQHFGELCISKTVLAHVVICSEILWCIVISSESASTAHIIATLQAGRRLHRHCYFEFVHGSPSGWLNLKIKLALWVIEFKKKIIGSTPGEICLANRLSKSVIRWLPGCRRSRFLDEFVCCIAHTMHYKQCHKTLIVHVGINPHERNAE